MEEGAYDYDWSYRCDICDAPCASLTGIGIKIHKAKMHKAPKHLK